MSFFLKEFGQDLVELNHATAMRQSDLKDLRRREDLAAARAEIKKNSMMLYTSSQVCTLMY